MSNILTFLLFFYRGPFITALGRIWCPEHFVCVNNTCRRHLQDIGFVEENGQLYCEYCFEQFIAPACDKCHGKIKGVSIQFALINYPTILLLKTMPFNNNDILLLITHCSDNSKRRSRKALKDLELCHKMFT